MLSRGLLVLIAVTSAACSTVYRKDIQIEVPTVALSAFLKEQGFKPNSVCPRGAPVKETACWIKTYQGIAGMANGNLTVDEAKSADAYILFVGSTKDRNDEAEAFAKELDAYLAKEYPQAKIVDSEKSFWDLR